MFCGHCGQHNPDASRVCASCGQEIQLALNMTPDATATPAPVTAPQPAPLLSNLEHYPGPKGLGGWLLFFVIGNTMLAPIYLLAEAVNNPHNLVVVALDLGLGALALSTGIALFTQRRFALVLVQWYFIAVVAIAALVMVGVLGGNDASSASAGASGRTVFQAIRTFLVVGIWWMYFSKSKRVLATYGRNL